MCSSDLSDATSGVATTEYSTDGGASWDEGAFLIVSAQGETTVSYRSVDAAGNVETVQSSTVRVDTVAPVTSGAKLSVRRGRRATFRIKVADPTPCSPNGARVMIRVRTSKGRSVKTLTFRNVATNKTVSLAWAKCNLKRGTYRYTVYATDAAGNLQRRAGGNRLVVR